MKRLLKVIIPILVVLPLMLYVGIVFTNNAIADRVEQELTQYPLPASTVFVESVSVAGKLTGNGNGMQYMGAILVTSDLSGQEILQHYQTKFKYIEVHEQTSPAIESIRPGSIRFDRFNHEEDQTYYSVICWGSGSDYINDFFCSILDLDLRGH